jgi:hypothetical protein
MNRREFFALVAGVIAAAWIKPQRPVQRWHEVGTFWENGHWVTYFPPVELSAPFVGSQRSIQFKSRRLKGRDPER